MSYTLHVNLPNLSPGAEVEIDKLGVYKNGETYEVSPNEAAHFATMHGKTLGQAFRDHLHIHANDPDEVFAPDVADPEFHIMELEELDEEELREMLADKDLDTEGDKAELVARLQAADNKGEVETND